MALLQESSNVTVTKVCIGRNRYISRNGSKAMYLTCLDSYDDDDENSSGEFAIQFRCDYDEWVKFGDLVPAFDTPLVVTMSGQFVMFAGDQQFQPDEILSVKPFKPLAVVVADTGAGVSKGSAAIK